mmetsp:Transcript_20849/g.50835  ORF Transcript_20849/g.50835 Transcript_20849/m.50835 type:complete len:206 (-) Transcript_20849:626-1243(-)
MTMPLTPRCCLMRARVSSTSLLILAGEIVPHASFDRPPTVIFPMAAWIAGFADLRRGNQESHECITVISKHMHGTHPCREALIRSARRGSLPDAFSEYCRADSHLIRAQLNGHFQVTAHAHAKREAIFFIDIRPRHAEILEVSELCKATHHLVRIGMPLRRHALHDKQTHTAWQKQKHSPCCSHVRTYGHESPELNIWTGVDVVD